MLLCTTRQLFSFFLLTFEELTYYFLFYILLFRFEPTISGDNNTTSHSPPPSPKQLIVLLHNAKSPLNIDWIFFVGVCLVFGLAQISFIRAVFPKAKGIPDSFSLQSSDNITTKYTFIERDHKGEIRKCKKCGKIKPDRSHHCSRCNRCILKMDHHCPFLANCIGFSNYKFFILFLFYTVVFGFITIAAGGYHIYANVGEGSNHNYKHLDYYIIAATAFALVALLLFIPFLWMHIRLIFRNLTTIEHLEKRTRYANPFGLRFSGNFVEVFGNNPLLWFLPVWSSKGDGLMFTTLPQTETSSLLLHT